MVCQTCSTRESPFNCPLLWISTRLVSAARTPAKKKKRCIQPKKCPIHQPRQGQVAPCSIANPRAYTAESRMKAGGRLGCLDFAFGRSSRVGLRRSGKLTTCNARRCFVELATTACHGDFRRASGGAKEFAQRNHGYSELFFFARLYSVLAVRASVTSGPAALPKSRS